MDATSQTSRSSHQPRPPTVPENAIMKELIVQPSFSGLAEDFLWMSYWIPSHTYLNVMKISFVQVILHYEYWICELGLWSLQVFLCRSHIALWISYFWGRLSLWRVNIWMHVYGMSNIIECIGVWNAKIKAYIGPKLWMQRSVCPGTQVLIINGMRSLFYK